MTASEVKLQWGVRIPLRDGVWLSATLYLPVDQVAPSPVVFTLTPYVGQTYHERGVYFASHGLPFLTVDVRGRGNSDGVFKANGNEGPDGHDVVEWLAQQPWCNGKVAMWGGSYGGYVQWAVAGQFPPHLVTIVPVAAPFRGVDSPMRNGIFSPYRIQWLTLISGRTAQDRIFADQSFWSAQFKRAFETGTPFRQLDGFLGNPSPIFQEWLTHPERDAYWDAYNPTPECYSRMSLPVLTITGMYDGNQPGALMHYREHLRCANVESRARHYLVIGPWDHAGTRTPQPQFCGLKVGPASVVDLNRLHRQWYAWTLQDGPRPDFLRKNIAYYVMVAEKWRYADSLEGVTARAEPFYLRSTTNPIDVFHSGELTPDASPAGGPDSYVYDPLDVRLAGLESTVDPESRVDVRMVHARSGRQLVYHTAPFTTDTEITGFFELAVWLSIDRQDTDFSVAIYEIGNDGSAVQLTNDCLRARYRTSLREPRPIGTQDPLRYDFLSFMFVSRLVRKGCRLRLVIGPVDSIYAQKNYNSGGVVADESLKDAQPVTVRLFHDASRPSVLRVPFGQQDADHV